MKIALVGGTGFIGSKILAEAVNRGHAVTAICRNPENILKHEKVRAVFAEVTDTAALTSAFVGNDVVIHGYAPPRDTEMVARIAAQTAGTKSIIAAAKAADVTRILAVGGAGTLLIDGVRSMDRPEFPKQFEGGAKATAVVKEILHDEPGIEWTVLSPSTMVAPGERTGKFRLGLDDLLVMADGTSRISVEDYAVAMVDELEKPQHTGRRFTVGY
ncbi:MAG: NAD(P)H-binding protein [Acidobacteriota bacterium]